MNDDRLLLLKAIKIAEEGIAKGCGPFGAIVVKDGTILAEAVNRVTLDSDPTAHAEVVVIREAAKVFKSHNLSDCTLYCSYKPCPMCLGAIYWAGISRVVYACDGHYIGRDQTWKIERKNLNFEIHLKRLSRRTICYSKSEEVHDNVIGMYIERYYFKTVLFRNTA